MARISSFIVGMMVVSLIVALLMVFVGYGVNNRDIPMSDDSMSSFKSMNSSFNQIENLTRQAKEIQGNTTTIQTKTGITDILGNMFSGGYQVLIITTSSFGVFNAMMSEGINQLGLGIAGQLLGKILIAIVIIMLFFGVIVAAIVKWRV